MTSDPFVSDAAWRQPLYCARTELFRWHQFQGQGTNDCAAFCVAIVANAIRQQALYSGSVVAREMERTVWVWKPIPHFAIRKIPHWVSLPWGISGYLQSQGIPARLRWQGQREHLLHNLQEDRTTIVLIGAPFRHQGLRYTGWAHAKILYGFEPPGVIHSLADRPSPGLYFVDPGFEKDTSGLPQLPEGVLWQDETDFMAQWDHMLRIYVEVGPRVAA